MLASDLYSRLSLFALLTDKNAISASYRSLQLTNKMVRGCSAFGIMEVDVDLPITHNNVYVAAEPFLQLLKSLPAFELKLESTDNTLSWTCGTAKGKMACLTEKIDIPALKFSVEPTYSPENTFSKQLELGIVGCGSQATQSLGLFGVTLDNAEQLIIYSSDNSVIARAFCGDPITSDQKLATLNPSATRLLCALTGIDKCMLALTEDSVYAQSSHVRLILKQIPPLKHDLKQLSSVFLSDDIKIALDRDIITAFIQRAEALAETKGNTSVFISVEEGHTKLTFEEGRAMSEEFYLVEKAVIEANVAPIELEAKRLSRALAHTKYIAFDYAEEKSVLVLHGDNGFVFIISGKEEN